MVEGSQETEIKLPVKDAEAAINLLESSGFAISQPRIFEANTIYDTPELRLQSTAQLFRIRQAGNAAILTYKGPPTVARHKSREELEVQVSDADTLGRIADRLG